MQLNVEQKKIIESKPNGHTLIKGVAGSGKTTVAVSKVPILLKNYCVENDDFVLVSTFNKSLVKYVSYIYEKILKEENFQENLFNEDNSNKLEIRNIDSLMYSYFNTYKSENNLKLTLANPEEILNALLEAIAMVSSKYPDIKIIDNSNLTFLKDEIMWIKACNYIDLYEYQTIDRVGRVSKANQDGPQKIRKNSRQRSAIFEVLNLYNENLKKKNKIDFNDMNLLALKQAKRSHGKKYTHIQSIYLQAWLVKNRSFASLGYDMAGKSTSLSKNYRTTTQIAQAAFSLINKDEDLIEDDNFVKPNLIDKQG